MVRLYVSYSVSCVNAEWLSYCVVTDVVYEMSVGERCHGGACVAGSGGLVRPAGWTAASQAGTETVRFCLIPVVC